MDHRNTVARIPPGCTLDAVLDAMRGLGSCYPAGSLSIGNDPATGGTRIIFDPAVALDEHPAEKQLVAQLGVDNPADLITFALTASGDDQEDGLKAMAAWMARTLNDAGAANYLTFSVEIPDTGRYAMTVQRCDGVSPAERIADLETQLAAAQTLIRHA